MNATAKPGLTLLLAGLAMFGPFAIDTMFPAFPAIAAEFGADDFAMQQTLSIYLVALALMSLVHGPLSDALGRRPVVMGGVALFTLASVGCALTWSIESLWFFRALQGAVAGAGWIVARAIMRDLYEGPRVQRLMSNVSMLFTVAPALAPMIGGWVLLMGHWRWIFWFLAGWGALLLAASAWRLPESHPPARRIPLRPRALLQGYLEMLLDRQFWPLAIAGTMNFSAMFLYISSAPAFVVNLLKLGPQQFGWLFVPAVSGMFLGSLLSSRLAGRYSLAQTVGLGYLIMLLASGVNVTVALLLPQPQVPWSVLPIGLHAIGISLSFPALTVLLLDRFPLHRGGASSLQAFVSLVFNAVLAGLVSVVVSVSVLRMALASALLTVIGGVAWQVYKRKAAREAALLAAEAQAQ
ncbi:multidrug effflux MFS transporter [Tahibacter harae]|uniref:Bcr/CflA family efflux transporter n=1 Tax=Tahibacter harae TaxID=2963937 RepID=A0ABT1QSZ6_9GAMM|nr:multidrug effflux MFS transporter [Tahibacter harae]MCQ4165415.1 multidrug effflux MFS transporter [Tahibacter harae]